MEELTDSKKYDTPVDKLVFACYKGHYAEAQKLLASGISPDCQGILKTTPLNAAVTHRQFKIVNLLLENGADINFESGKILSFSRTPLAIACNNGDIEMAEYLIERGANVDLMSGLYGNPLHAAIQADNMILLSFLLKMGASIEAKHGAYLDTPICAAARLNNEKAVEILAIHGAKTKRLRKMPRHTIPAKMVQFLKSKKYL